ncbi:MAG TPA: glutathione S-transferase [Microvirga sp.]|jgi:glutathione S-transferase|nr:glutathione S-transferase [Microvirga sp.]
MTQDGITLYGTELSGHTHRVALLLRALGLPFRFEVADAAIRATPAYRAVNPLGQIPALRIGDLMLCDSNAILVYLAKRHAAGSHWLPEEALAAASVQRWLSIAAGEVRYGPAAARMARQWNMPEDPVAGARIAGRLLAFMEEHLAGRTWLATDAITIADLACYSYVAHAPEGGIGLDAYPNVRRWVAAVEAQPWFRGMPALPHPAVAA